MSHALIRQQTVVVVATTAVAMSMRRGYVHIRQRSGTRGSSCAALRVARRTLASGRVGRRRSLEGRFVLFATCCAHVSAVARAHNRPASLLQHALPRAASKATTVTATMAAINVKNDVAGASGEQLRRVAALTGMANEQDAKASVYPTRAM
eukprot:6214831-Pleurochrysis_carterae.AAC.1